MKSKKFLAFALVTATLALSIVPSAFAATDGGTASVTVGAPSGGSLSITLSGDHENPAMTGAIANSFSQQTATTAAFSSASSAGADWIKVEDSLSAGHTVTLELDAATMDFSNTQSLNITGADLSIVTDSSPDSGEAYLTVKKASSGVKSSAFASCTPNESAVTLNAAAASQDLTTTPVTVIANTDECAGQWYYTLSGFEFKGKALNYGQYSVAATATVY